MWNTIESFISKTRYQSCFTSIEIYRLYGYKNGKTTHIFSQEGSREHFSYMIIHMLHTNVTMGDALSKEVCDPWILQLSRIFSIFSDTQLNLRTDTLEEIENDKQTASGLDGGVIWFRVRQERLKLQLLMVTHNVFQRNHPGQSSRQLILDRNSLKCVTSQCDGQFGISMGQLFKLDGLDNC